MLFDGPAMASTAKPQSCRLKSLTTYPERLGEVKAASFWMSYLTAYGAMIELGKLQKGEYFLVTAASSSVGL